MFGKSKENSENNCRNTTEIMARTKATLRRIPQAPIQRISNNRILNRRVTNAPYKIKKLLPQTEVVKVKKNGQVLR